MSILETILLLLLRNAATLAFGVQNAKNNARVIRRQHPPLSPPTHGVCGGPEDERREQNKKKVYLQQHK